MRSNFGMDNIVSSVWQLHDESCMPHSSQKCLSTMAVLLVALGRLSTTWNNLRASGGRDASQPTKGKYPSAFFDACLAPGHL